MIQASLPKRLYNASSAPAVAKVATAIRFGILGAANIAPAALIQPAKTHPEVIIAGVAARDKAKAEAYARTHGIEKTYGGATGYQDMLNDPSIDAVYNPLPNGLHFEWSMKALEAGKHVLMEKPSTNRADEMERLAKYAESKGLVLLEAFHSLFHPAIQRVKQIVDSGELGPLKSITANLEVPKGTIPENDIRWNFDLGGGAGMDMGVYVLVVCRYLTGTEPTVVSATPTLHPKQSNVDSRMVTKLSFPSSVSSPTTPVEAEITADMSMPPALGLIPRIPSCGVTATCESGSVELFNFVMPGMYHYLKVSKVKGAKVAVKERSETAYAFEKGSGKPGEEWWSTYRYQLEAFVNKVKGREPQTWFSNEDSVKQAQITEQIYEKSGLGVRPASNYVSPSPSDAPAQ